MNKLKKMFICFATLAYLVGGFSQVNAAEHKYNSGNKTFSKAWSSTPINTAEKTFKYGYNTFLINEDYTHTYHKNRSHTAYVKNTGKAKEKKAKAGKYAKAEITHKTGRVYYTYSY